MSIKPYKNKALNMVLQSLHGAVSKSAEDYQEVYINRASYTKSIMKVYNAHFSPVSASLPPLDVNWAKSNDSVQPKVHYSLLSELLRLSIIDKKFITTYKGNYLMGYQRFIQNQHDDHLRYGITLNNTPAAILKHTDLHYMITNGWLNFWMMGIRIKRPMSSHETGLIESFRTEIKVISQVIHEENDAARKYGLKCSCFHMEYLIGCMRFALVFDLLNHQDHSKCVDLIETHRDLVLEMFGNSDRVVQ